ncbi:MAG: hypothetical protein IKE53_06775 [Clostridiales bacterium]|nr:hypothetical protein [Clostridiales bacterium]
MDEMWNQALTRENITDFYYSTVTMVYPSVFDITKETTRAENAIVKSYLDIYSKRDSVAAEDVIYVFGDILLKNAQDIVEMYPLPDNLNFAPRLLDEYTRNSMLEKIIAKIDSTGFKVAEFISSDNHNQTSSSSIRKYMDVFPITPLLIVEIILVSLIIWLISWAAIKVPYTNDKLIDEQAVFESASLQEKYVTAMGFYPLNPNIGKSYINNARINAANAQAGTETDITSQSTESVADQTEQTADTAASSSESVEGETSASSAEGDTVGSEPSATRG